MNAAKPYDSAALADLVIRSSDQVDFYVLGSFLRYVSPIFRAMFSLNSGQAGDDNEKKDGYPVVCVAEDSSTLRLLLDSIYPTFEEPQFQDLNLFWRAARASQKYCMEVVEEKFKRRMSVSTLMHSNPLGTYAVATDLGWGDVAIAAARKTLQTPLESLPYVQELKGITGAGFYRFLEYRLRCSKSSNPEAEEFTHFPGVTQEQRPTTVVDTISNASSPFDSSAPADLILRSSNFVDFFVSGTLIRRLSANFKAMFPFPPEHETKNGMPVVCVEENSEVLHCLLSIIHHDLDEPDMKDCRLYIKVVQTIRKYKMTTIEGKLCRRFNLIINSLQAYIIATVLGWEGLANMALRMVYQPLDQLPYVNELHLISGADFYRLMQHKIQCMNVAKV